MRHVELLAGKLRQEHQINLIIPEVLQKEIFLKEVSLRELDLSFYVVQGKWDWMGCLRLYRFLRKTRPDIFHLHLASPGESTLPILASYIAGIPITITTEHSPSYFPLKKFYSKRIKRFCQQFVDLTIALSKSGQQFLVQQYSIDPGKIQIVYNGVEILRDIPDEEQRIMRGKLGIREDARIITAISEITERKGINYLLQAAARLIEKKIPMHLQIIGEGPMKRQLQGQYRRYVEAHHISFLGYQKDVAPFLSISDFFVLPSLGEELPISILEAMAARVPVIAAAVGGISDIICHGESGWLVKPGDSHDLTQALVHLMQEKEVANTLADNALRLIQTKFSLSEMAKQTEVIYRSLLAAKRGSF